MRVIDKIIIHCSATPQGRANTVDDIDLWHRQRGFAKIGYHYVVYIDGSVHKGRTEQLIGAHCMGYNARSIGVCYIGGTDAEGKPKDTRTEAQRRAMQTLIDDLRQRYPQAKVHGHNEFSNKDCPCFEVRKEFA